jgi:hypothetical protein
VRGRLSQDAPLHHVGENVARSVDPDVQKVLHCSVGDLSVLDDVRDHLAIDLVDGAPLVRHRWPQRLQDLAA